jgi:L-2-hydroxyglutarate oxidase LhgO
MTGADFFLNHNCQTFVLTGYRVQVLTRAGGRVEVVASLAQGRTAAAQCGLFTHKSVPVIFEPPCYFILIVLLVGCFILFSN